MQISAYNNQNMATLPRPAGETLAPPEQQDPKDSFGGRFRESVGSGMITLANDGERAIGGIGGIVGAGAGLYAGALGGALLGTAIGLGMSGAVGAMASDGVIDFLRTSLTTTASAGQIGIVAGSLTGLVGGWSTGKGLADIPTAGLRFAGKKVLGRDPDAGDGGDRDLTRLKGPWLKGAAAFAVGVGGVSGGTGGAILGASVFGASDLVTGLIAKDLSWASVTGSMATGALVGGIALGVVGVVGGYKLVTGARVLAHEGMVKVRQGAQWLQLDEKENRLTAAEARIDTLAAELTANREAATQNHSNRTTELDGRESDLSEQNERIDDKHARFEELVGDESNRLFDGENSRLGTWEGSLNQRETDLHAYKAGVDSKENNQEMLTEQRKTELYDNRQGVLQGEYDTRKGGLDSRQSQLDTREREIPNTVAKKVADALRPFEKDLSDTQENTRAARNSASRLRSDADSARSQAPVVRSQANRVRSEASDLQRRADGMRGEHSSLSSDLSSKTNEFNGLAREASNLRSELARCNANKS